MPEFDEQAVLGAPPVRLDGVPIPNLPTRLEMRSLRRIGSYSVTSCVEVALDAVAASGASVFVEASFAPSAGCPASYCNTDPSSQLFSRSSPTAAWTALGQLTYSPASDVELSVPLVPGTTVSSVMICRGGGGRARDVITVHSLGIRASTIAQGSVTGAGLFARPVTEQVGSRTLPLYRTSTTTAFSQTLSLAAGDWVLVEAALRLRNNSATHVATGRAWIECDGVVASPFVQGSAMRGGNHYVQLPVRAYCRASTAGALQLDVRSRLQGPQAADGAVEILPAGNSRLTVSRFGSLGALRLASVATATPSVGGPTLVGASPMVPDLDPDDAPRWVGSARTGRSAWLDTGGSISTRWVSRAPVYDYRGARHIPTPATDLTVDGCILLTNGRLTDAQQATIQPKSVFRTISRPVAADAVVRASTYLYAEAAAEKPNCIDMFGASVRFSRPGMSTYFATATNVHTEQLSISQNLASYVDGPQVVVDATVYGADGTGFVADPSRSSLELTQFSATGSRQLREIQRARAATRLLRTGVPSLLVESADLVITAASATAPSATAPAYLRSIGGAQTELGYRSDDAGQSCEVWTEVWQQNPASRRYSRRAGQSLRSYRQLQAPYTYAYLAIEQAHAVSTPGTYRLRLFMRCEPTRAGALAPLRVAASELSVERWE